MSHKAGMYFQKGSYQGLVHCFFTVANCKVFEGNRIFYFWHYTFFNCLPFFFCNTLILTFLYIQQRFNLTIQTLWMLKFLENRTVQAALTGGR